MNAKIAEEFYNLTEWLKTKEGTEDVLNDFLDRELGDNRGDDVQVWRSRGPQFHARSGKAKSNIKQRLRKFP